MFGPSFCWRPGVPRLRNTQFLENVSLFGLAAEGGKANKNHAFLEICGFLALVPQASSETLGQQKHFGIPLIFRRTVRALIQKRFGSGQGRSSRASWGKSAAHILHDITAAVRFGDLWTWLQFRSHFGSSHFGTSVRQVRQLS